LNAGARGTGRAAGETTLHQRSLSDNLTAHPGHDLQVTPLPKKGSYREERDIGVKREQS